MSLSNTSSEPYKSLPLSMAIVITLVIVIFIRESAVLVCQALGYPSAGNIVGMITLFTFLLLWRSFIGLPHWITAASNTLLVDSGFAFLPVSAGAGLLMFGLGNEIMGITITIIVSTLIPLWFLAKLSDSWLGSHDSDNQNNVDQSVATKTSSNSSDSTSNSDKP